MNIEIRVITNSDTRHYVFHYFADCKTGLIVFQRYRIDNLMLIINH